MLTPVQLIHRRPSGPMLFRLGMGDVTETIGPVTADVVDPSTYLANVVAQLNEDGGTDPASAAAVLTEALNIDYCSGYNPSAECTDPAAATALVASMVNQVAPSSGGPNVAVESVTPITSSSNPRTDSLQANEPVDVGTSLQNVLNAISPAGAPLAVPAGWSGASPYAAQIAAMAAQQGTQPTAPGASPMTAGAPPASTSSGGASATGAAGAVSSGAAAVPGTVSGTVPGTTVASSWFTESTVIPNVPNWTLAAAAAGLVLLILVVKK